MAGINQTTRPGQYLILQSGPVPAVLSLQGITTATQGETASASYALAFRLTGYGQAWPSQWRPLAELAAASALFAGRMQHVQVRFTHTGDPATLQVDSFTLTGTAVPPQPRPDCWPATTWPKTSTAPTPTNTWPWPC